MVRNKANDVSAGDWLYQTREDYRNVTHVAILFFSFVEILINNDSLCNKKKSPTFNPNHTFVLSQHVLANSLWVIFLSRLVAHVL